jgi:hypothetical protein
VSPIFQAGAHAEAGSYRYNNPDTGVFASGPAVGAGGNKRYSIKEQLLTFLSSKSCMHCQCLIVRPIY